jgi:hypothetical protein
MINRIENGRYRVARFNICVEGMVPEARQKAYRMSQLIFTHISDHEHVFVIKDTKIFTF